ncbi:hypothetical protein BDQ12DRAFT_674643, partial [Crucibulum laeve]
MKNCYMTGNRFFPPTCLLFYFTDAFRGVPLSIPMVTLIIRRGTTLSSHHVHMQ